MKTIIFVISLMLAAPPARAEIIELKNGTMVQGKIISQSHGAFKVKSAMKPPETYYLYEIKAIDGKPTSMDDPFQPFVLPSDVQQVYDERKIHIQEQDLFSLILPKDYQWFELPNNILVTDASNRSRMAMKFSMFPDKGLTEEQKKLKLKESMEQAVLFLTSKGQGSNFEDGVEKIARNDVMSTEFLLNKRGSLFYASAIALHHGKYLFAITTEAETLEQRRRFMEILETIDFSLSSVDDYFEKGKQSLEFRQFDLSQKLFAKVLEWDPLHVEANYLMALSLFKNQNKQGRFNEQLSLYAEKCLQKALELNPKHMEAAKLLGFYYTKLESLEKANVYLEKYRVAFPRDCEVLFQLGLNYETMGLTREAIAVFAECLALAPHTPELYLHLARCHLKTVEFGDALAYIKEGKALFLDSENEDYKKDFEKLEKEVNAQIRKTTKNDKPGVIFFFYLYIMAFVIIFIKGWLIIKQSVSDVDPLYKEDKDESH